NWALDEKTYFEIIRRKTASLCGTCCRLGALVHEDGLAADVTRGNGASERGRMADALYDYGEKIGIAFQIIDDLLDLTGTQETVGKTLGRDLEKGKLTLPRIQHLATSSPAQRQELLRQIEAGRQNQPIDVASVRERVVASGAVAYASEWAARLITMAKSHLSALPDSPARQLLADMADAVLTRKF